MLLVKRGFQMLSPCISYMSTKHQQLWHSQTWLARHEQNLGITGCHNTVPQPTCIYIILVLQIILEIHKITKVSKNPVKLYEYTVPQKANVYQAIFHDILY